MFLDCDARFVRLAGLRDADLRSMRRAAIFIFSALNIALPLWFVLYTNYVPKIIFVKYFVKIFVKWVFRVWKNLTVASDWCTISRVRFLRYFFILVLCGCSFGWRAPDEFVYVPITAGEFEIATWRQMTDAAAPIHIYIEGDGHAFNGRGMPTSDPTPRGTFMRDMAAADSGANVVYMARPCQYIMSPSCDQSDWTDGRFSAKIIDSVADAIIQIAGRRPVVLIGYSGGAMVSGLVIKTHPEINVAQWITIAGVLNHTDWTGHFGDSPLTKSMDMTELPDVPQTHYVGSDDDVVPPQLTQRMVPETDIVIIPGATHDDFGNLTLDFLY